MVRIIALLALPSLASAATPLPLMQDEEPAAEAEAEVEERKFDMEIGLRARMLSVPDSVLDIWFYDSDDAGWAAPGGRPDIRGKSVGMEFIVKGERGANGIFYFDYLMSDMKEGYWDDIEEPPNHMDGDFLEPSSDLGFATLGADFGQELFFVHPDDNGGKFGLGLLIGAGLGVGVLTGEIQRWGPEAGSPGFVRYLQGEPSDGVKEIPKVLPVLDVNAGLRFTFGERFVMRFEGGVHDMLYYGASAGVMF